MKTSDGELATAGELVRQGRLADALAAYERYLGANPAVPEAHFNRAVVLRRLARVEEARAELEHAHRLRPGWGAVLLALGQLDFEGARYREAEAWFQRAVDRAPDSAAAHCNLGIAQSRQLHPARALPALVRARELAPREEVPWFELRRVLNALGRTDEADRDFLRFEASAPPSARLVVTGLWTARRLSGDDYERRYLPLALDWPYTSADLETLSDLLGIVPCFDVPRERVLALYRTYDRLAQAKRGALADLASAPAASDRPLRVGLVSADFRTHVMGRIVEEIVARHDAAAVAFHLYSLMPPGGADALTARLRARCAAYTELRGVADYEAARRIAADRLHVLVDLMGHTSWSRPEMLLWKPAPVIVTHLGYHGAIGLRQVDFKLTDAVADLPDAGAWQIEAPLPMDGCIIPIRNARRTPRAPRPAAAPVAFGAFVGLRKMSPRCLAAWARILARAPGTRLVFSPQAAADEDIFRRRVASFGIDPARVDFLPMTRDEAQDRGRYAALDVALDAFPYTGGDSAACALAEGVPFVTRCGPQHAQRVATSVLTHLGITETIAASDDEYVDIAVRLAQDPAWRARVDAAIAAALPDHDRALTAYTRSFEAALREAWRLRGGAPAIHPVR
jgi:protein O-GlcNAc transferase